MSQKLIVFARISLIILILMSSGNLFADEVEEANDLFELSIEELMNVEVESTATKVTTAI